MKHEAHIVEIFSSFQGEGPYTGERMTFVRFSHCSMRCQYCDTPQGLCEQNTFRVEAPPGSGLFVEYKNPISATNLSNIVSAFADRTLSITGGEPLEQARFLAGWLPSQAQSKRILLETNGIHHEVLDELLPYVHIVSMDIKLPSSSGTKPRWDEHSSFLQKAIASGRETYVKIVVTAKTSDRDIQNAITVVGRVNKFIPVIIQPATPTLCFNLPPRQERTEAILRLCHAYLPDVRFIPQRHKEWDVL